jgi:hypothetical protein
MAMKFDDLEKLLREGETFIDFAVKRLLTSLVPQFS